MATAQHTSTLPAIDRTAITSSIAIYSESIAAHLTEKHLQTVVRMSWVCLSLCAACPVVKELICNNPRMSKVCDLPTRPSVDLNKQRYLYSLSEKKKIKKSRGRLRRVVSFLTSRSSHWREETFSFTFWWGGVTYPHFRGVFYCLTSCGACCRSARAVVWRTASATHGFSSSSRKPACTSQLDATPSDALPHTLKYC